MFLFHLAGGVRYIVVIASAPRDQREVEYRSGYAWLLLHTCRASEGALSTILVETRLGVFHCGCGCPDYINIHLGFPCSFSPTHDGGTSQAPAVHCRSLIEILSRNYPAYRDVKDSLSYNEGLCARSSTDFNNRDACCVSWSPISRSVMLGSLLDVVKDIVRNCQSGNSVEGFKRNHELSWLFSAGPVCIPGKICIMNRRTDC